jgi:hypothetical protein
MRTCLLLALLACSSGCIGAAAWPCIDVTPPINVGGNDVVASRCETTTRKGGIMGLKGGGSHDDLTEVPVHDGHVDRQAQFRAGGLVMCLIFFGYYENHDLKLVLKRRGYEDEEISSWPWWFVLGYTIPQTVDWKKLPDTDPLELRGPAALLGLRFDRTAGRSDESDDRGSAFDRLLAPIPPLATEELQPVSP